MFYYCLFISIFAMLTGFLTFQAIRSGGNMLALLSIFVGTLFFGLAAATDILGTPKPLDLEWRSVEGSQVIALLPDTETKTLFVWAVKDGVPRAYSFEYESAQETADAVTKFRGSGRTGERMTLRDDYGEGRPYEFVAPKNPLTK